MGTQKKKPAPRNGKKTSPEVAAAQVRAAKALEMRMEGLTFEAIAEALGYAGKQGAYDAVRRSLAAVTREPAEELIKLDLERLDGLWQIQYLNAQAGDVQAMAACMKIMERRAKLLGLDAPVKVDNKTEVTSKQGVLVVGGVMSPEEWEQAAKAQQASLQAGDV